MRRRFKIEILIIFLLFAALNASTNAQMKKIVEKDGLGIYFLFYSEGNGIEHNGVVIYLKNENNYPIDYSFVLIFRADQTEKEQEVKGMLKALERKTGSNEGLYFIPFADKRSISEVGVTKIRVNKTEEPVK
jgi:hypothetical protein